MSVILKNDRGTYDLFLECTRFPDVSGRDVVQDVPESNLGPRLWDALYRGRGIFIDDVQHSQGDRKNDWDPVMFSKIDNVVIIPLQKSDKFAGMVVLCNISEESRDGYIRFVPMLKVILENDIQNFGARQASIHVEAEPEQEKEEKSYLWDTLFQDGNIGNFYKDSQRRYVDANENFLSWYHLEPGELLGKTDEELGMHEFSENMKEEEEQILATGVKILNQIRRIVWDGEERFVLISKLPVWKNGVLKGIVGYVMDLTSGDALDTSVYTLLIGPQRQNRQQVVELGRSWETGYRENGRDFAYLSVQVMQREEFASRFGEEACRQMKRLSCIPSGIFCRERQKLFSCMESGLPYFFPVNLWRKPCTGKTGCMKRFRLYPGQRAVSRSLCGSWWAVPVIQKHTTWKMSLPWQSPECVQILCSREKKPMTRYGASAARKWSSACACMHRYSITYAW